MRLPSTFFKLAPGTAHGRRVGSRVLAHRAAAALIILALVAAVLPAFDNPQPAYAAALPPGCQVFKDAGLIVNGQQVYPDVPLLVNAGRMLVPIRIIAETLGADVSWDQGRQTAIVETPSRHIEMAIGSATATMNTHTIELDAPAALYQNRTLVPLRFVAESMGCQVLWDDSTRMALVEPPASGRLTSVDLELLPECAVLHVRTDNDVIYSVKTLTDPPRLAIDLEKTKPGLDWTEKLIGQALVTGIRIGVSDSGAKFTRVVVDLKEEVRFSHAPAQDGAGVDVEIYYKVEGVVWENGGLTIHSSGPLQTKTFALKSPDRYVIDLPGASLSDTAKSVEVGSGDVLRARIAQFQTSPDVVRVVIDLEKPMVFRVARSDAGLRIMPEQGQADPPPEGKSKLTYESDEDGGRFILQAGEGVEADVAVESSGRKLQLQVSGASASDLIGAGVFDGIVESYEIEKTPDGQFSVVVKLTGYAGHELDIEDGIVTLDLPRSVVAGHRIVVDPGHGGIDPGCTSYSGVYEKYVNWPIAALLKARLQRAGAIVKLTRDEEESINAYGRADVANNWGAEVVVSIHCNAHVHPDRSGTEVWHYGNSAESRRLATLVMSSLAKLGLVNRGVKEGNYAICRETYMPAILAELGFLTNPGDERVLLDPAMQARIADLLMDALQSFFR